ncbi:hypothetical protein LA76x_5188 [Lysobacter antibioticus]|uniref:Uncharacterized protein n=1 Tax=Lysobacter antibioticus TaxID=84531 RepID=A0A0S2FIC9_LYSAN|nr:hypothetical protein LA76x_5188 [Lysobacter antibioticus]
MPAPGFFDRTSLSYRKTAHVLCAALRVYDRIASSELRQAFTATATAKTTTATPKAERTVAARAAPTPAMINAFDQ